MDPDLDTDPAIFVIDLQDANKQLIFLTKFSCLLLFEGTFTSFFKDKSPKKSQNSRNCGGWNPGAAWTEIRDLLKTTI